MNKKSWLYYGVMFAVAATLIGVWSHLTTSFSVYEVKDANSEKFPWSFAGSILASAICAFLILTAIGINKIEKRLRDIENNKENRNRIVLLKTDIKALKRYLLLFAVIEMYGNIFYSIAAKLDKTDFGGMWITGISIFMFSFSLTLISIVGSKLLSIFSVNDDDEEIEAPKLNMDFSDSEIEFLKKLIKESGIEKIQESAQESKSEAVQEPSKVEPVKLEPEPIKPAEPQKPSSYFKD